METPLRAHWAPAPVAEDPVDVEVGATTFTAVQPLAEEDIGRSTFLGAASQLPNLRHGKP